MNYYPHHIGDFRSGTINMTRLERWIYRDMVDVYYDKEQHFPLDLVKACDLVGARSDDECKIVAYLLRTKFIETPDGYAHERCDLEIAAYQQKADTARTNGKGGGRPKKPSKQEPDQNQMGFDEKPSGLPVETGLKTNQEPITKNHKPRTKVKAEVNSDKPNATGTRLPADWKPSPADVEYCKTNRPDLRPSLVATNFYDYWIAIPGAKGRKLDWSATWRGWVRKESAANAGRTAGPVGSVANIEAQRAAANAANNLEAKRLLGINDDNEGKVIENAS